jgi:hypothetical protein
VIGAPDILWAAFGVGAAAVSPPPRLGWVFWTALAVVVAIAVAHCLFGERSSHDPE